MPQPCNGVLAILFLVYSLFPQIYSYRISITNSYYVGNIGNCRVRMRWNWQLRLEMLNVITLAPPPGPW